MVDKSSIFLFCLIFVHIFQDPIKPISVPGDDTAKRDAFSPSDQLKDVKPRGGPRDALSRPAGGNVSQHSRSGEQFGNAE